MPLIYQKKLKLYDSYHNYFKILFINNVIIYQNNSKEKRERQLWGIGNKKEETISNDEKEVHFMW